MDERRYRYRWVQEEYMYVSQTMLVHNVMYIVDMHSNPTHFITINNAPPPLLDLNIHIYM